MVSVKQVECIFILIPVHSEDKEGGGGGVFDAHFVLVHIDSHLFLDEHKMGSSVSD